MTNKPTEQAIKAAEYVLGEFGVSEIQEAFDVRLASDGLIAAAKIIDHEANLPTLLAENERLRGALEWVWELLDNGEIEVCSRSVEPKQVYEAIRAALAGGDKT